MRLRHPPTPGTHCAGQCLRMLTPVLTLVALAFISHSSLPVSGGAPPESISAGTSAAKHAALLDLVTDPYCLQEDAKTTSAVLGNHAGGLDVRRSNIPQSGRGAFALRDFQKGERLGEYYCHVYKDGTGYKDPGSGSRTWSINATHSCDGSVYVNYLSKQ